jgi:activator of HSP90 ATPase
MAAKKKKKKAPPKKKITKAKVAKKKSVAKKKVAPKKVAAKKSAPKSAKKTAKKTGAKKVAKRAAATPISKRETNGVIEVATIVQEEIFDAAPMDVYEALIDPAKHAAFTKSTATGEPIEGGAFTAWDGYIAGRHERLVPGARIVQLWRTTEFPHGHPDSRLELELRPEAENKTRLRMTHSGVPRSQAKSYEKGWVEHYWDPLREYLRDESW